MASYFGEQFKLLTSKKRFDEGMLLPFMRIMSFLENDVEAAQDINIKFTKVNRKLLISEVALYNSIRRFISCPRAPKEDEKTKFFYDDICKYWGWTPKELQLNIDILDLEDMKGIIAKAFGYDNKQRKLLKLSKLKGTTCHRKNQI